MPPGVGDWFLSCGVLDDSGKPPGVVGGGGSIAKGGELNDISEVKFE